MGVLALILLGPKELPVVLRALGRWVAYLRRIAHDAQLYFESISQLPTSEEKVDEVLSSGSVKTPKTKKSKSVKE